MRRTQVAAVVILAFLVAAAAAVWLLTSHHGSSSHAARTAARPAPTISVANARYLVRALGSTTLAGQAKALVPRLRVRYLRQGQFALPPGSKVIMQPTTFRQNGNAAVINAVATGSTYILHLFRVDGTWLILYTEAK